MAIEPVEFRVAQALLSCLCTALNNNAAEDPSLPAPVRCCLRAGVDIPLDVTDEGEDLCCGGEAYVKIISTYPSTTFPQPDEYTANDCQMQRLTVALELGVFRCLPLSPTCDESSFAVRRLAADRQAAMAAACCWGELIQDPKVVGRGAKFFVGSWDNEGPEGMCVGGTMPLFASVPGPGCC